jgi:hypothetical protein
MENVFDEESKETYLLSLDMSFDKYLELRIAAFEMANSVASAPDFPTAFPEVFATTDPSLAQDLATAAAITA